MYCEWFLIVEWCGKTKYYLIKSTIQPFTRNLEALIYDNRDIMLITNFPQRTYRL